MTAVETTAKALDDEVAPDPTITSFDPTSGPVGTTVTLLGTHLTGAFVHIGSKSCPTGNVTDTSVEFVIPEGAATDLIVVSADGGSVVGDSFTVTG